MNPVDPALFDEGDRMVAQSAPPKIADIGPMTFEHGGNLDSIQIAYQTWGELNADASNAILVCHAISGDSNALNWWSRLFGSGCVVDPAEWLIVCSNVIGGCSGTTGPSTLAVDGKPHGSRFPRISVGDMVEVQARLADQLGIQTWALVCGGSMGGMQALEWSRRFPNRVKKCWVTASAPWHSALQIGFNEVGRHAIRVDPKFRCGNYPLNDPPRYGMAVGRMMAHLSYVAPSALESKFGREVQSPPFASEIGRAPFERPEPLTLENYLAYQGQKFADRFDANTWMLVSRAIDDYVCDSLDGATCEYLFTSFTTDWLYPAEQSGLAHELALKAGCESNWFNLESNLGHDAFLLDDGPQAEAVKNFLKKM